MASLSPFGEENDLLDIASKNIDFGGSARSIFDSASNKATDIASGAFDKITDTNFLVSGGLALVGGLFASKVSRPSLKFASLAATTQVALGVGQALKAGASTIQEIANAERGRSSANILPKKINVQNLESNIDEKIQENNNTTNFIRYPIDLPSAYSMTLSFYKYKKTINFDEAETTAKDVIRLPLPANLVDVLTLQYNNIQAGPFRGAFLQNINQFAEELERVQNFGDAGNLIGRTGKSIIEEITSNPDVARVIGRGMIQKVSPTTSAAIDLALGNTVNPHNIVTFNGVGLRAYRFSWRLSPNSFEDSKELQKLIFALKHNSLPTKRNGGNLILNFPNFVRVKIYPQLLSEIFAFRTLVMDQASFNFAPSGTVSFHADDTPTEVEITISLREVDIQTAEDYDKKYSSLGFNPKMSQEALNTLANSPNINVG